MGFMLKIRVQCMVGAVTLLLFDWEVKSILKIYTSDLIEKYEKTFLCFRWVRLMIFLLKNLIGRKIGFKLIVESFTTCRKYVCSYNIPKISDIVDIIFALEKLEKVNCIKQDIENESVNCMVSYFNSQDTVGFKDLASFAVDNTPISTFPKSTLVTPSNNHDTDDLMSPSTNVKRKLGHVYNLDDIVCESSTKSIGVKEGIVSTQLLIPKVKK
uniref:Uncharacterized protein n=1 Tax=Lactuca sativa TaxID=4236 RepID=A0A9R1W839_LACSA|nr:hypothetical protein LSAT_V11C300138860 [Lactuca sativa]